MLRSIGVKISNCGEEFEEQVCYLLFETRRDIPAANMALTDPNAAEFR